METFSALLALCAGNSSVTGEFPTQRPVTRAFDVFFNLRLNKRLSKQWWGWWFETPSRPLWRHWKYIHNSMWNVISHQRSKFNCWSQTWMSNYIPWIYVDVITYAYRKRPLRRNSCRGTVIYIKSNDFFRLLKSVWINDWFKMKWESIVWKILIPNFWNILVHPVWIWLHISVIWSYRERFAVCWCLSVGSKGPVSI